ncbi:MAG: tetratricopeptide repeat protein, partial [Stellaceae bacterium]
PAPGIDVAQAFTRASTLHGQGNLADAERGYLTILSALPAHFGALQMLGVLRSQQGKFAEAVGLLAEALRVSPNSAEGHHNIGIALGSLGRREEALQHHWRALALKPNFKTAHLQAGMMLHALGRHGEAVASYRNALAIDDRDPNALNNLGSALRDLGRGREAAACYEAALRLDPDQPEANVNLGNLLYAMGRHEEAIVRYQCALAARPSYAEAHYNLGNSLKSLNRLEAAIASFQKAVALKPDFAIAQINLGNCLLDLERRDEAIASYRAALATDPDAASAHNNLANALFKSERFDEAIESYRRALALDPSAGNARAMYAHLNRQICDWSRFSEDEQALIDAVDRQHALILPFVYLTSIDDPAGQLRCARGFVKGLGLDRQPRPWTGMHYAHDRIRVAYLSTGFHEHATAFLMAELFERHDRHRFEIYAISLGPSDRSAMRGRLDRAFHRFLDVRAASDPEVAQQLRALEIDIAVDLIGFTRGCRPGILARRPAPIQVNYLGYPGSMGADFIDYLIADLFVLPLELSAFYAERIVHLPECYQPNDSRRPIAERTPTRGESGLAESGFVFACFNNNHKITPQVFDVWMRLLRAIPDSILWLVRDNIWAEENLRREAQARGVSQERLVFAPRLPLPEHLARHRLADLFLDTLPYNAHTTASDALWAGLPIVTCAGRSFAARVAGSLLTAVGLPELVATSLDEYEDIALKLARSPELLAMLRARLQANRATAPLFDAGRLARHLEAAYLEMLRLYHAGETPRSFAVPPT